MNTLDTMAGTVRLPPGYTARPVTCVEGQYDFCEKELRPGEDLSTRELA